jgi:D-threo-aldose 1-dehydrogenase
VTVDVRTPRPLGRTGLAVTGLCVGTGEIGGIPVYGSPVPEGQALATARRAFAGPLNFVDTSNGYGLSEKRLGTALAESGGVPEGLVLATKVDPEDGGPFDGRRVLASARESMGRLGLDHLPLLYLHDPERISFEQAMAPDGPVAALGELVAEGVVAHLGVAGGPVELLRRFVATGSFEVVLTHNRWTLLDRSAGPLLEDCAAANVAVVNGAPFGGGILAKGPVLSPRYAYRPASPALLGAASAMHAACTRFGVPMAAVALQHSLRHPRITSTIVGMSRPERYDEALALAARPVPDDLWSEMEALTPAPEHWLA